MSKINRRDFIIASSSGLAASVILGVNPVYAQVGLRMGAWRSGVVFGAGRTTQLVAKALIRPATVFEHLTTQYVAKAAVGQSYVFEHLTTQVVAKAAVGQASVFEHLTTQIVVKVAAR